VNKMNNSVLQFAKNFHEYLDKKTGVKVPLETTIAIIKGLEELMRRRNPEYSCDIRRWLNDVEKGEEKK